MRGPVSERAEPVDTRMGWCRREVVVYVREIPRACSDGAGATARPDGARRRSGWMPGTCHCTAGGGAPSRSVEGDTVRSYRAVTVRSSAQSDGASPGCPRSVCTA